uniref:Uncharacterized protein n=1 Tax=Eutreptiella gymnastica TaxID=73025 RepID=A0A7S1J6C8_9EUGL|mmetsp:Transcript_70703/g.124572  ORF Transcript_70703/g.124572 Transcript_70703/m.124572 type:complete len:421 (+) Transcript_70703:53-1315(+)
MMSMTMAYSSADAVSMVDPMAKALRLEKRAILLAENGNMHAAIHAFQKTLELNPNKSELHEMLAQCLMECDAADAAVPSARRACELKPEWPEAHLTLAHCLYNSGSLQLAVNAFKQVLTLRQDDEDTRNELLQAESLLDDHWRRDHDKEVSLGQGRSITVRQWRQCSLCTLGDHREGPGYVVWDSAVILTQYLSRSPQVNRDQFQKAAVLELGSGTGLLGLALAQLGADVVLSDLPQVVPLLEANASFNGATVRDAGGTTRIAALDWKEPLAQDTDAEYQYIVGADVVYSFASVLPFVRIIHTLRAKNKKAAVFIAHKRRMAELDAIWQALLQAAGLKLTMVPVDAGVDFDPPKDYSPDLYAIYSGVFTQEDTSWAAVEAVLAQHPSAALLHQPSADVPSVPDPAPQSAPAPDCSPTPEL